MEYTKPTRKDLHLIQRLPGLSLDPVTLTGGNFVSGEVLGVLADGRHTKLDLTGGATEAHEACAVLYGDYDASAADLEALADARLVAVRADKLVWPDGITAQQKADHLALLGARNIIAR